MKSKILTGIMLILLSLLLLTGFNAPVSASDTNLTGEVGLGALLPMTGAFAALGETGKVAAEFARDEVNEFLLGAGASWSLSLTVEDTQSGQDPSILYNHVESLYARGIELIVGPFSGGEIRVIKDYLDSYTILAISPFSDAPDLAVVDDYIFRFFPRMGAQGHAIGRIMYDGGKRYVIPVTRNDAWGIGLEDAVKLRFEGLGGTFLTGIRYDPGVVDFGAYAADLANKVSTAIDVYGADDVAILHLSFEEAYTFITACSQYPVLDDIKWYGSEGTAKSTSMLTDFAVSVEYECPIFIPTYSDKWAKVYDHFVSTLLREPDPYAYIVYDIVWAYALSLLEVDVYDSDAVKAVLPTITQNYFGASGWIELDENGDRKGGDFAIWRVIEVSPGTYDWDQFGAYIVVTDSIIWGPLPRILGGPPLYIFEAVWNSQISYVVTESNSTVSDYYFNPDLGPLVRFNVTGLDGTVGFCRVGISKQLLQENWAILVDDEPVNVIVVGEDDYYMYVYFTYSHSTRTIKIIGAYMPLPSHDVTVLSVTRSPTSVSPGDLVTIRVTVKNEGEITETFNVTVYYDNTQIEKQTVPSLPLDANATLTFNWGTTGVSPGTYTIKAVADIVAGETDTADNTYVDGTVTITTVAIHDIAITDIRASPTTVIVGDSVSIEVDVLSEGTEEEAFDISVYYNTTLIDAQTGVTLSAGAGTTLPFTWDTTDVPEGTYTIKAVVPPVTGETDTADNTYVDGTVTLEAQAPSTYKLTVSVYPTASGETDPAIGVHSYTMGENVVVTVTPASGYKFDYWELDGAKVSEENTYTVNMNADHTIKVYFKEKTAAAFPLWVLAPIIGGIAGVTAVFVYLKKREPEEKVPKPAKLRITAEPAEILADGKARSTITIRLVDKEDKPIAASAATEVKLAATGGKIDSPLVKVPKGKDVGKTFLVSSTESGIINVSADAKGLKSMAITLEFVEKPRFCMGCGSRMSVTARKCEKCGASPQQFVGAAKVCRNCERRGQKTYIPATAEFCSECGASQPKQGE